MNSEKIKNDIIFWLKENLLLRNKKAFLIVFDENNIISSILNLFICKNIHIPIHVIYKKYINNSLNLKIQEYIKKNNIPYSCFENSYIEEFNILNNNFDLKINYIENLKQYEELSFISFISYIKNTTNSLYVGNLIRNDYYFFRNYSEINCYDLLPFINFSQSELFSLINEFNLISDLNKLDTNFKIDLNFDWLYNLNIKNNIIESNLDPTKNSNWFIYTSEQKKLIAQTFQIEKLTRFKKLNGLFFERNE